MVQQTMLKIIRSDKANQTLLVTGCKQNKWKLGKLEEKKISFTS
jgi:hypothetical protein